jgi:hypothetical protein
LLLEASNPFPTVVQHRVARRTHGALKAHLDQLFAIEMVEQLFSESPWQVHPIGHRDGGRLGQHRNVF